MYTNRLKRLLSEGKPALGISFQSDSPITADIVSQTGIDYATIDMEHGPFSSHAYEKLWIICKIMHGRNVTPIAKVGSSAPEVIGKALDAGIMGIILPHCKSRMDAQALVRACRYPPLGDRGISTVIPANDFVSRSIDALIRTSNDEVMPIPMIEDSEAMENLDEITDEPGVAALRVARVDLALSYGVEPGHPTVREAIARVIEMCRIKGIAVDVNERSPAELAAFVESGVRAMCTIGVDHYLLHDACKAKVDRLRSGSSASGESP